MATGQEQEKEEGKEIKVIIIIIIIRTQQQDERQSAFQGQFPWERSHRVREIQNPVPSSWRGQQVLGLVWHPLGAKGPVRSRKPCKGKGRKAGLRGSSEEHREHPDLRLPCCGQEFTELGGVGMEVTFIHRWEIEALW